MSESKVVVEKISNAFFEEILSALKETNTYHYDCCPEYFSEQSTVNDTSYLKWIMSTPDNSGFMALVDNKLAGVLLYGLIVKNNCYKKVYYIHDLVVKKDHRKLGIGKKLCDALTQKAEADGIEYIEGEVFDFNKSAMSFYENLGYQKTAITMIKHIK